MRGLLLKDLAILKCQKRFYGIMIVFCVLYAYMLEDPSFVIGYVIIMSSVMTLNSLAYDEHDNGNAFLFTMPFTRAEYVKEKYLFGSLSIFISAFISVAICVMMGVMKGRAIEIEMIVSAFLTSLVGVIFMGINLPVHIKFGQEKGKMVVVAIAVGMFVMLTMVSKTLSSGENVIVLPWIEKLTMVSACLGATLITVVVVAISKKIAIREMEKKEF